MKGTENVSENNIDAVDIVKFLLAVLVCLIHVMQGNAILIARTAVPLFFLFSSYFFAEKLKGCREADEGKAWIAFLKRIAGLYLFWSVVLLPITLRTNSHYFSGSLFKKVSYYIGDMILGQTFGASWYLSALVICVSLLFFLRKRQLWIYYLSGVISYVICCFGTNYLGLLPEQGILMKILDIYPGAFYLSFPAGLLWVGLGKLLSDYKEKWSSMKTWQWMLLLCFGGGMLCMENVLIRKLGCMSYNDCYFTMPFTVIPLFIITVSSTVRFRYAWLLRKMSTVLYVSHGGFLYFLPRAETVAQIIFNCGMIILLSFLLTLMLVKLQKSSLKPIFKWSC